MKRVVPRYRITAATPDFDGLPREEPRDRSAHALGGCRNSIATAASFQRKVGRRGSNVRLTSTPAVSFGHKEQSSADRLVNGSNRPVADLAGQ